MLFHDRADAGRQLASALSQYRDKNCLVLALPRGGVPVAKEVADALHARLDLILVRKISAPDQPELALGAVVDGFAPVVVRNETVIRSLRIRDEDFAKIRRRKLAEIERRRGALLRGREPLDPTGKIVIVVDDGIATGATMRAALQATRSHSPKKLIMAVPVASEEAVDDLKSEADEVVCLATPNPFLSVGRFYGDFDQLTDQDVRYLMDDAAVPTD